MDLIYKRDIGVIFNNKFMLSYDFHLTSKNPYPSVSTGLKFIFEKNFK